MSTTLDTLQALDVPPVTVVALTIAAAALVVSDPLVGRRDHRALLAAVAADTGGAIGMATGTASGGADGGATGTSGHDRAPDGEPARIRLYRRWTRMGGAWAAAVVVLVAVLPGIGVDALGLRTPDLGGLGTPPWSGALSTTSGTTTVTAPGAEAMATAAGMLTGLVAGALAVTLVLAALRLVGNRRARTAGVVDPADRSLPMAGGAALAPMLPTTARGRRGWAALSVTAGITEEVTYRGLVVLTLALLLTSADAVVVVVVAAVLFGLAHAYQGPAGMLATGLVGAAFTGLYLSTGSLLLPMVLHVLVDLRVLLLAPRAGRAGRPLPVRSLAA